MTRTVMSPVFMSFELPETLTHPDQSNQYTITSQTKSQVRMMGHQPEPLSKIFLTELENIIKVKIINIKHNITIKLRVFQGITEPCV